MKKGAISLGIGTTLTILSLAAAGVWTIAEKFSASDSSLAAVKTEVSSHEDGDKTQFADIKHALDVANSNIIMLVQAQGLQPRK